MRIVFVSSMGGMPWGGSEELWSQAAVRMAASGHTVIASVAHWPTLSPKIQTLKTQGVAVHVRPPGNSRFVAQLRYRLFGAEEHTWLRRLNPDLVIVSQGSQTEGLGWMLFCHQNRLPYFSIVQCNAEGWWPHDDAAAQLATAYANADKVFCVSRHNLDLLERQLGQALPKGSVVCNPYQVPNYSHQWPDPRDGWKMACVARLDPAAKGQDILFQVLSQPAWRDRPVEVELYGVGPAEQGLRKLAERLELRNVRFRGHTADVAGIWKRNHLLVLPSRFEGTPLALIEAMWCGRPAVVTDAGGNAELCVDGGTGFVAPAPSFDLLGEAMERAWNRREDWRAMGEAARRRVQDVLPEDPVGKFCEEITAWTSTSVT